MSTPAPRALIAEDEPLLAAALAAELRAVWPELQIVATAANGPDALRLAAELAPDILFLDIRMPGMTGLEVAEEVADALPPGQRVPHIVFVTAHDEFAVAAFERAAVDYVLKPVTRERLERTVQRLQERLVPRKGQEEPGAASPSSELERLLGQLRQVLPAAASSASSGAASAAAPGELLRHIRAGVGNTVKMVPVEDVCFLQATDKYVNVVWADGEALIRTSLRELQAQLPPGRFQQIHRSTVVNMDKVAAATRDDAGRLTLSLRGRQERLPVSRIYADLFRQM
jgi:DNA-binding LytR/AlgR family response regulator